MMPHQLSNQNPALLALSSHSRHTLIKHWEEIYGAPPPKGIGRRFLEQAAAFKIQSYAAGGVRPATRRRLQSLAKVATGKGRARSQGTELSVGSRLVREWGGRTYTVDVVEGGYRYDGTRYRSLSSIARKITGTRWSGPRFFGL